MAKRDVQIRKRLEACRERGAITDIVRRATDYSGVVLAVGSKWVLVHLEVEARLDGWAVLRLSSIRKVRAKERYFAREAMALLDDEPFAPFEIDLDDTSTMLSQLAADPRLVGIVSRGRDDLLVGSIEDVEGKEAVIRLVDPAGDTESGVIGYRTKNADVVEFGGTYLDRLSLVAHHRGQPD